jgi:hypothetical protein
MGRSQNVTGWDDGAAASIVDRHQKGVAKKIDILKSITVDANMR